jgi:hypothetical protein
VRAATTATQESKMAKFKAGDLVELSAVGKKTKYLGKAHGAYGMVAKIVDSRKWSWKDREYITRPESHVIVQWFGLQEINPISDGYYDNGVNLNRTQIPRLSLKRLKQKK